MLHFESLYSLVLCIEVPIVTAGGMLLCGCSCRPLLECVWSSSAPHCRFLLLLRSRAVIAAVVDTITVIIITAVVLFRLSALLLLLKILIVITEVVAVRIVIIARI